MEPLEEAPQSQGADVIDLTELLRRSLKGGKAVLEHDEKAAAKKSGSRSPSHSKERAAAAAPSRKRSTAAKAPAKKPRARRAA